MITKDSIIQSNISIFKNFKTFDVIKQFELIENYNPINIYKIFDIPVKFKSSTMKPSSPLYWKLRGYEFNDVYQNINNKTSGASLYAWLNKNCEPNFAYNQAKQYWDKWNSAPPKFYIDNIYKREHYIERGWSEEDAINMVTLASLNNSNSVKKSIKRDKENDSYKSRDSFSIEGWMNRGYTEEEAIKKRDIRLQNNKSLRTIKYWMELGCTEDEAKIKVSEFQSNSAKKLYETVRKNGTARELSHRCKEYWIARGYTEEEAIQQVSIVQSTFTLNKCIDKHGIEEGIKIWQERQDRWQATLNSKSQEEREIINSKKNIFSLDNCIRLYGDENGSAVYQYNMARASMLHQHSSGCVSKESITFFNELNDILSTHYNINIDSLYGFGNEISLQIPTTNKKYFYDYTIPELNLIIEYHGIAYHPKIGNTNWISPFGNSYNECIEKDLRKKQLAIDNGYTYKEVFSDERNKSIYELASFIAKEKLGY